MGTGHEAKGMLAQGGADRQAHSVAGPAVSTGAAGLVKVREVVSRPPLPSPDLYDAYVRRAPPQFITRPAEPARESAPGAEPLTQEQVRQVRSDALTVSPADARLALEAWAVLPHRR